VLKDGQVAESGTHHELLDRQGVYAKLWAAQETSLGQDMELERNMVVRKAETPKP
jgi:ATP-binding cassette, subfamily B (MDR/TAP), member 7